MYPMGIMGITGFGITIYSPLHMTSSVVVLLCFIKLTICVILFNLFDVGIFVIAAKYIFSVEYVIYLHF